MRALVLLGAFALGALLALGEPVRGLGRTARTLEAKPDARAGRRAGPLEAAAARLAEARALSTEGRLVDALAVLEPRAGVPRGAHREARRSELAAPLGAHLLALRAALRARLGFHGAAALDYAALSRSSLTCLADRARVALPEQLFLAGRFLEAARAFQRLSVEFPHYPSPSRWLNGEAASRLLAGDQAAAAALLGRLLVLEPASPEAARAAESRQALKRAGIPVAPFTLEEELRRLRRLGAAGALDEALGGLRSLASAGRLDRPRARLEEARLLSSNYRYDEAVALLGPLSQTGPPGVRGKALELLPKALARSGPKPRPKGADGAKGPPSKGRPSASPGAGPRSSAGAALPPRARLRALLDEGQYAAADRLHQRLGPGPTLFGAYLALQAGAPTRAAAQLRLLVLGPKAARGARYWLALATRALGKPKEAEERLLDLAEERPLDWYGLLARAQLAKARLAEVGSEKGTRAEPTPRPMPTRPRSPDLGALVERLARETARWPALGRAAALLWAGLREEALFELGELARAVLLARPGDWRAQTLRPLCAEEAWRGVRHLAAPRSLSRRGTGTPTRNLAQAPRPPGGTRQSVARLRPVAGAAPPDREVLGPLLYRAFAELGDPYLAGRFASPAAGRPTPRLATPFSEVLLAEAQAAGLPPGRLWAVMTVESAWCPNVVSSAGALGLLQIMPRTGLGLARLLGAAPFHLDALFLPEVNLRFGAVYLASLRRRFGGQHALAVAAYNGGPHNVARWVTARAGRLELDGLVEEIPFRETRTYVKKVMSLTAQYAVELGEPLEDLVRLQVDSTLLNNIDF